MKTTKIMLSAGSIISAGFLFSCPSRAAAPTRMPTLNYSEDINCASGGKNGYFDLTYFNSEVPIGSNLSIRFGFERDDMIRCQNNVLHQSWAGVEVVPMKQWEEFGWFVRISRAVVCAAANYKLTGIDFIVEVQPPAGNLIVDPAMSQGIQTFFRGNIPNMNDCEPTVANDVQKTCAAQVEWVNVR